MKITKKILVVLFMMMVMLGIGISKVDAAFSLNYSDLGKTFHIGYNQYHNSSKLFCVEKYQKMHSVGRNYTVIKHIKIKNSTSWRITKKNKKGKKIDTSNNKISKDYNRKLSTAIATLDSTQLQTFLWGYFEKWNQEVGSKHYSVPTDFATNKKLSGYETANDNVNEAIEDMESAVNDFDDATDYENINYRTIKIGNTDYIRVGPYKIDGLPSGGLESFELYNQDGQAIAKSNYKLIKYNESKEIVSIEAKDITSKNFYICIPIGSKITKISAKISKNVNTLGDVTADIYLLQCSDYTWQNLIYAKGDLTGGDSFNKSINLSQVTLPGKLIIYKYDAISGKTSPLKGAEFEIFRYDNNGTKEYVTKAVTNEAGRIEVDNLKPGVYIAKEVKAPEGYDTYQEKEGTSEIILGQVEARKTLTKEIPNSPQTTNLRLEKVNEKDHSVKIEGVRFRLHNMKYGWLIKNGDSYTYTSEPGKATWFETDKNGILSLERIPTGEWEYYEDSTSLPYGYYIEGKEKGKFTLQPIETNNITVTNLQRWVKLSGYVWVDKPNDKELSGESRNDLFDDNSNDRLLDGITVKLIKKKDQKTEVIKETTTGRQGNYTNNGHGEYIFEYVEIADLPYLYIEFEYDGLTYTNAVTKIHEDNGSKAAEGSERRNDYNERFSEIIGSEQERDVGFAKAPYQNSIGLKYDIQGTQGTKAILKSNELYKEEYDKEKNCYYMRQGQRGDGQLRISADTKNATNINGENCTAYNGKTDGIFKHFKWGQTEVKNINLGLKDRDQPDIALSKDIHNVKVSVNGYSHTYMYNQINKDSYTGDYLDGNPKQFNVGVKFREKEDGSYRRAIYTSDYEYDPNDKNKQLKVYVTYELKMVQSNANLIAKVNRIAEYYDANYTVQHIGTKVDNNGDINKETYIEDYTKAGTVKDKYQKIIIPCNIELNPQEPTSMYVQFQLDKDSVVQILQDKDAQNPTQAKHLLNNIAEIDSYTILDKKKRKIYAGIDMNSNPGNCTVEDPKTYENDTSAAPGLRLELAEAREMTGKVFKDEVEADQEQNPNGIMVGKVRQGNGIYDETEEGIEGVEVTLKDDISGMTYKAVTVTEEGDYLIKKKSAGKDENEKETEYTVTAEKVENNNDNNPDIHHLTKGEFYIIGYVPGDYTLTYRWGDEEHKVQNYKGTIYKEKERQTKTDNTQDSWWYIDKKYDEQGQLQPTDDVIRYSDAMDNYETRKAIDEKTREIRKDTKQKIEQAYEGTNNENGIITKMDSTTPLMKIDVEYKKAYTDSEGRKYSYCIDKVDFGIVERAKQDLVLTKRVNTLKATLANGQVVVDVTIDEKGNVKGEKNGLTYMKPSLNRKPINGFVRLELDNELIQGTKLEIGYVIKATNKSELDYIPENEKAEATFYLYGEVGSNKPISMTPKGIIDYLDKNWSFDSKNQTIWNIKQTDDIKEYVDVDKVVTDQNSTIGEKIILYTESLKETKLIPPNVEKNPENLEESAQVELQASKMLTTTDEIALNNEAEEVEVDTEGGKPAEPTPGNYMPSTPEEFKLLESDEDMAETTIVTPATGKNLAYILPITIGTTALIILGVGIMVIKKKTL